VYFEPSGHPNRWNFRFTNSRETVFHCPRHESVFLALVHL
jgi:hypothetical protein